MRQIIEILMISILLFWSMALTAASFSVAESREVALRQRVVAAVLVVASVILIVKGL